MPLPDPLKSYRLYVAMFLLNLAVVLGVIYLLRREAPREILVTQPLPRPTTPAISKPIAHIMVLVAGAVNHPGTLELTSPARVADALQQAGLLPEADLSTINLTQVLQEGDTIRVPIRPAIAPAANDLAPGGASAVAKINLNTATLAELDGLPGIGPTLAQRILDYRAQIGGFTSIEQIVEVKGIGDTLFAEIKELVTVP